jgi:uncharacterized integral membrane protein (TIGR00698 family)
MIAYPAVAALAGLDGSRAGLFIGGTIHDVAQVVGAGYAVSPEAGDAATVVKLMRVAMLVPTILVAGLFARGPTAAGTGPGTRPPLLPWFVVAFVLLVAIGSAVTLPAPVRDVGTAASTWCLVAAMAAIGARTRLGDLVAVGPRPVLLMVAETLFIAGLVLAAIAAGLA